MSRRKNALLLKCFLVIVLISIFGFGGCDSVINAASETYTLTVNVVPEAAGEVLVSPQNGPHKSGTRVALEAVPAKGYIFYYWNGDITDSTPSATLVMNSNKSVMAYFRLEDGEAPIISEVKVTKIIDVGVTIEWTTDEPASSRIDFGPTSNYGETISMDGALTMEHKIKLRGLAPATKYYFVVKSKDESGNEAVSEEFTFATLYEIPVAAEKGKRAPDFTLPSYQDDNPESPNKGQVISLSDFNGKRVVLNLWTTFCGACIGEFPIIREVYQGEKCKENTSEDLAVITIDIDGRSDRIKRLEEKYFNEVGYYIFPILIDTEEAIQKSYHISSVPMTFFVDSDGIIREIKLGRFQSIEEIEEILKNLD